LAHLVDTDPEYREWYKNNPTEIHIMDNSAFELNQQGLPLFDGNRLDDLALSVGANYVVMTDAPGQSSDVTENFARFQGKRLKSKGLGTFFVPQSYRGKIGDLINSFIWGLTNPDIDYVALSILSAPNAFTRSDISDNAKMMTRYLSRYHFMRLLEKEIKEEFGISARSLKEKHNKKIHFLGMTEGPNEIELMSHVDIPIDTWDSSAPMWYGLRGRKRFDPNSVTGLPDGKYTEHVDFNYRTNIEEARNIALDNLEYIDNLVQDYNDRVNP
jgi:hypothetical protein